MDSPFSRSERGEVGVYVRRAGADMMRLFGERVGRRQGKGVVPAFVSADQEASRGARGNNYTNLFLICASPYPVLCSPDGSRISGF